MPKKEIRNRLLVTLIWLLILTFFRWRWYLPFFGELWRAVGLWLGGLTGTFFLEIDHLLYALVVYPQELTSQRVKRLIEGRRFKEILTLLYDTRAERVKLTFHSALFQVVFVIVCFFVLTSTGSVFGAGLVMVAFLQLLSWEIKLLLRGREEELKRRLFWQIKKEITLRQQKAFVIVMLLIFLGLNLLLI